jgi:exodeoxyribonuclease III
MKLATWNVNSLNVRLSHVLDWLKDTKCDLLCLQETKLTDDKFPQEILLQAGYDSYFIGQKTYNGVALLVRKATMPAPTDIVLSMPNFVDEQKRIVAARFGNLRVICGYFPNGESLESDKFQYKMAWLNALHDWVQSELASSESLPLVLTGDFNIAPTDADVHDPALWAGKLHCSDQERAQFQRLISLGLTDSFRMFEQAPKLYSWWDYRMMGFRRNAGLRIDHVLVSEALKDKVKAVTIDKAPRKLEKPSDHTPVICELDFTF